MIKYIRDKAHCKHEGYTKEDIDKRVGEIENQVYTDVLGNCDLNTLTEHCHYALSNYYTYQNAPLSAGYLHVLSASRMEVDDYGTLQILYSTDGKQIWVRGSNNPEGTSWSEWCKYTPSEYATITATVDTDDNSHIGIAAIPFPSGFTKDNCIVISTMYKCDSMKHETFSSGPISTVLKEFFVSLGKVDGTDDNNVYVQLADDTNLIGLTYTIKITLMKI